MGSALSEGYPKELSALTTMRVGGKPKQIITCSNTQQLYDKTLELWETEEKFQVLAGGSNIVFADDVSDLNVLLVANRGIEIVSEHEDYILVQVQAGHPWDEFVEWAVTNDYAGIEAMSGIPGSTGATPVQNVGAYGQEVSEVITQVEFLDQETGKVEIQPASFFDFSYRDSAMKHGLNGIIGWVEFRLQKLDGLSVPMASGQITEQVGAEYGSQLPLRQVRDTALELRSSKGMVVKIDDPDSVSCGSFFTNPLVSITKLTEFPEQIQHWKMPDGTHVKLSAGWLIEQAGFPKGYSIPGSKAAISNKHALAITNRGGATSREILELARLIQERVSARWGINLIPEPNLIGF